MIFWIFIWHKVDGFDRFFFMFSIFIGESFKSSQFSFLWFFDVCRGVDGILFFIYARWAIYKCNGWMMYLNREKKNTMKKCTMRETSLWIFKSSHYGNDGAEAENFSMALGRTAGGGMGGYTQCGRTKSNRVVEAWRVLCVSDFYFFFNFSLVFFSLVFSFCRKKT